MAISTQTKISAAREFTDRIEPREAFWRRLDKMIAERGSTLVTYYGAGGVGKSCLLKKIRDEFSARREEFPNIRVLYHDFIDGTDCRTILNIWKNNLKEVGCEFPFFETGDFFLSVRQGVNPKLLDEPEVRSVLEKNKWLDKLKNTFNLIVNSSENKLSTKRPASMLGMLDALPEIDPLSITGKTVASVMRAINKRLSNYELEKRLNEYGDLRRELTEKVSTGSINEIEELLPTLFARDVLDWAGAPNDPRSKRLIIFLDTFELLTGISDDQLTNNNLMRDWWIREQSHERSGLLFRLPPTLWVICGRNKLRWSGEADAELDQHLIKALAEDDSNYFLMKAGVWSREIRDRIYQLTGGYPLYLDLCLDTYEEYIQRYEKVPTTEDFGQSLDQIVNRLMKYMDPSARLMVQCLSVLGTWTDEMARCIVANFNHNLYIEAKKFSFIQSQPTVIGNATSDVCQFDRTLQKFFIEALKSSADFHSLLDEMLESADRYFDRRLDSIDDLPAAAFYLKLWAEMTARIVDDPIELEGRYEEIFGYSVHQLTAYGRFNAAEDIVGAFHNSRAAADNARLHALFDYETGLIMNARGLYREELVYNQSAYEKYAAALGDSHPDTIDAMTRLINNLFAVGRFREAVGFKDKLLRIFDSMNELEPKSVINLADALRSLGRCDEALELYERLLPFIDKETPAAAALIEMIADTLEERCMFKTSDEYNVDDYNEVLALYEQVLEMCLRLLGERDLDTVKAMENMARTLTTLQRRDEAVEMLEKALALREELQGEEHTKTLETMGNLTEALRMAGRLDEALELGQRYLSLTEKLFEPEHPIRLNALRIFSDVLCDTDRLDEALPLKREILEIRKQTCGKNDLDTMMAMTDLAGLLALMGLDEEAEVLTNEITQFDFDEDD